MQVVVMAAGMGSRFGGLKQIEPMDDFGNYLLDYSMIDAKRAGFNKVIFIIKRSFADEFKMTIGKRVEKIMQVDYAYQEIDKIPAGYTVPDGREKPWGTAHAILCAKDLVTEPFIIINADDFYGKETYQVAYDYLKNSQNLDGKYANVTFGVANTMTENGSVKRGVCFDDGNGYLTKLIESSVERVGGRVFATPLDTSIAPFNISDETPVSMNLFAFSTDIFEKLEKGFEVFMSQHGKELKTEYLIPDVVSDLVGQKEATLELLPTPSVWYGVTYKEDKPDVVKALKKLTDEGVYNKGLY